MSTSHCPSCGAPVAVRPDGSLDDCSYCGDVKKAVDPVALARTLGRDVGDIVRLVESLAATLETSFASRTKVEKSGFFTKKVSAVLIELDAHHYRIELVGNEAKAHRSKVVRGVRIKDEQLPLAKWIEELSHALSQLAQDNKDARAALGKIVGS